MNTAPENNTAKRLLAWLLIALQVAPLPVYAATPLSVDAAVVGAKPVLNVSANGVPIVQIVPPNTAGVSHNRFTLYNVGVEGQVLNNSGLGSASVLAGSVGGNPMLGNTNARLILNEVTSVNPTALNGRIEIAGKRADLVIANPNGISVDGGGFINTARAVLTTGTSQLTNGVVADTLSVQRGSISVQGKGLDARGADQLLLLSRSLAVNANLYANGLNAVTGANLVNGSTGTLTPQTGTGVAPTVAVDVSNLGGMYANSIYLVGTEAGVGVNSRGKMQALTGDIQLSSAGDITVTNGQLKAAWDVRANAKRDMTLQGTDVQADGDIELVTGRHLNVTATRVDQSATTVVGIANGTSTTTNASTQQTGSVLQAGGDIALVANTVANPAMTLNAAGYAAQRTQLESNITGLNTQLAALKLSGPVASYDAAALLLQTTQTNLQNLIAAYSGGKITLSGSGVRSEGNVLVSGADVSVNSVNDSKLARNVVYTSSTGSSWCVLGKCSHSTTTTSTTATQNLAETLKGGEISALGDVNILPLGNHDAAGGLITESGNLLLLGAKVNSNYGQVQLTAANDLEVEASQSRSSQLSKTQTNSSSGWVIGGSYSSDINLALDSEAIKKAEGTTVSGNSVQLRSGRDVMVRGSVLSADKDIQIVAGRDVDVVEARDLTNREMIRESKKSGLHSEGLFGISIGSSTTTQASATTIDNASSSQIGSIAGGVSITGGRNVLLQGTDVMAGTDIDIIGNNVSIAAAKNIYTREDSYKVRTSGLALALKGGVISTLESAWQAAQKSKRATDTRLKKVYDFKAGYDLYRATQQAPELTTLGKGFSELLSGNTAAASKTLGIQLELTLGASSSSTTTTQKQTDWRASNLFSNGDTTIIARNIPPVSTPVYGWVTPSCGGWGGFSSTGCFSIQPVYWEIISYTPPPPSGKVDIMGSNLDANNLTLSAGTSLTARNSQQTTVSKETSSNTSANIGVGFGQDGLYVTASGQIGNTKGEAFKEENGESRLSANNKLTLLSGGNADLKGTVAKGKRIEADIAGNLTLASLQDSERYQYKSTNAGGTLYVPLSGKNVSGSINGGVSTLGNQYQSVVQQTGLFAGDGGFNIKVGGLTSLIGAAIVSSAPASLNSLTTGDLTYSDLTNIEQTSVGGYTFGMGTGIASNYYTPVPNVANPNRSSITQSILSPGTIQVAAFTTRRTALTGQQTALNTQIATLNAQLVGYPAAQAAVAASQAEVNRLGSMLSMFQMQNLYGFDMSGAFNYYYPIYLQEQTKLTQLKAALVPLQAAQTQLTAAQASLATSKASLTSLNSILPTLTTRTLGSANPALTNTFDANKTRNTIEAMNVFSETAMRIVGDVYKAPVDNAQKAIDTATAALDTATKGGNAATIAAAQATLDAANTAMTTVNAQRIVAHGVVGGLTAALGGTNPTSGFVGGVAGKTVALIAADMLAKSGIDPIKNPILYNQILALATSAAGAIVGGTSGAFVASQGDRFNRQLHLSEATWLANRRKSLTAAGAARFDAAACAMILCAQGVPTSDPNYAVLSKMQADGLTYTAELNELRTVQTSGLFDYTATDTVNDWLLKNDKTIRRAGDVVQLVSGAAGTVGGGVVAASCPLSAGASCVLVPAGLGLSTVSYLEVSAANAKLATPYVSTEGQRVLNSFNLSTFPGERNRLVELGIDGATAAALIATAKFGGSFLDRAVGKVKMPVAGFAAGTKPNLTIKVGAQNKHIVGTNEYNVTSQTQLRSPLATGVNPQALVNQYAGTGRATNNVLLGQAGSKEVIVTNKVVGNYIDDKGNDFGLTTNFTIHYAKNGVHIVPARPTL